ncbi:hypothetical protein OG21DRAFT_1174937 [Imleria badia]|nr:hypothetical protein OG21DRAFT_1174937 [Imleria badia]
MTMLPVCSFSLMEDQDHNVITVIILTAVGYDYSEHKFYSDTMSHVLYSQSLHLRMRYIPLRSPLYTTFCSLIIYLDRIHLGQKTTACQDDMFLIRPQSNPWTWVSTLFIIVCIGFPSAFPWPAAN